MKLEDAYQLFLIDRKTCCSEKTCKFYEENLVKFLRFANEKDVYDTDGITTLLLSEYVLSLRSRYRFEGCSKFNATKKQRHIKNTSVRTYSRAVKAFVNYCKIDCGLDVQVRFPRLPKDDSEQIVPLYQAEVDIIDSCFNDYTEFGIRNYCIFHLMLDAGLRSREVIQLKIADALFDKQCLVICYSKSRSRVVLMAPELLKRLKAYIYLYRSGAKSDEPLFKQIRTDDYINQNVIKLMFSRLKKKTGIERLHAHLLRHTFATSYMMGGGNLEMLRIMLGHSDYNVTRNYLHLASQYRMLQADIYRLDPIFFETGYK